MKKLLLFILLGFAISGYSQDTINSDIYITGHHKIWSINDSMFVDFDSASGVIAIQTGIVPGPHSERVVVGLGAAQLYVNKGSHISIVKNEYNQNLLQNDYINSLVAPTTTVSDTLMLNHDPYSNLEAATKQYVDNHNKQKAFYSVPTGALGSTITLTINSYNIIDATGTVALLHILMPASPNDNDIVEIKFEKKVNNTTIAGTSYTTPPTTPFGTYMIFHYDTATNTWY